MVAPNANGGNASGGNKKPSQATELANMALRKYTLAVSPDGKPFAYTADSPHVALELRSKKFGLRARLARDYYIVNQTAPSQGALKNCLEVLEGMAMDCSSTPLYTRVAGDGNAVYIDMADDANRVIEICDGTWQIVNTAPYMFRRTELTAPMIEPSRHGKLKLLWRHVNIAIEDRPLFVAVMVDSLIQPNTSKPVTGLLAEHGSAKSTTARRIVELLDSSTVELRSPPKDLEQWITAAAGSWVVALDNLSTIPDWLSDAICRASTGEGNVKRQLYADDDLSVAKFRRSVIITGIDVGGLNGDLADRLVPIELRAIQNRLAETDLEYEWESDRADILGGLLTMAAKVHHKLSTLDYAALPRMADFGRVLASLDAITSSHGMQRYLERGKRMMADSALSNSFIARLVELRFDTRESMRSGAEILSSIGPNSNSETPIDWPKKSRYVTTLLTKHAPALRQLGWTIANDDGKNKDNAIKWAIHPPRQES